MRSSHRYCASAIAAEPELMRTSNRGTRSGRTFGGSRSVHLNAGRSNFQ